MSYAIVGSVRQDRPLPEGGALVHARGRTWGQLIFQDLFKKEQ